MTENAPAPAPSPVAPSEGPASTTPSPAQELAALTQDATFAADFAGENGRAVQIEAAARKSALTKAAHGPADEPAPELPEQVQDGLKAPDNVTKAAAEAMVPGASPNDYQFNWSDAGNIDIDVLQDMTSTAAEAAFEVGASPAYAKATIDGLQTMLTQSSGIAPTEAALQDALTRHFGGNSDTTVEAAKATLAKMPEQSRQWALDAAERLDASGVAWFVGRLASVHRANKVISHHPLTE